MVVVVIIINVSIIVAIIDVIVATTIPAWHTVMNSWSQVVAPARKPSIRDKDLHTTTNKCLQCLIKMLYTVF